MIDKHIVDPLRVKHLYIRSRKVKYSFKLTVMCEGCTLAKNRIQRQPLNFRRGRGNDTNALAIKFNNTTFPNNIGETYRNGISDLLLNCAK